MFSSHRPKLLWVSRESWMQQQQQTQTEKSKRNICPFIMILFYSWHAFCVCSVSLTTISAFAETTQWSERCGKMCVSGIFLWIKIFGKHVMHTVEHVSLKIHKQHEWGKQRSTIEWPQREYSELIEAAETVSVLHLVISWTTIGLVFLLNLLNNHKWYDIVFE